MQIKTALAAALLLFPPLIANAPARPEVLIQPYELVSLMGTVIEGEVTEGTVLTDCIPARMIQLYEDHQDKFLTLTCNSGKINIQIDNIIFDTTEKVPVHVVRVFKSAKAASQQQ